MATTFLLPGDAVPLPSSSKVTLGPGIVPTHVAGETVYAASKMGHLGGGRSKDGSGLFVQGSSKRYIPAPKELVLGTIIARHAEGYRVDIGSAQMAALDALAFEGATKRSKPNLKVGTLVYARVALANRDMEPEVECVDPGTGKADGFGELKGGLVVMCSLQLCRQLLSAKFPVLPTLAAHIPFEVAVGFNGRVWFKARTVAQTIALKRVLEVVDSGEIEPTTGDVERAVKVFMA
ncbi:exosome non-catalytic core subunit rrp40 [Cryptotrichosporon argae]